MWKEQPPLCFTSAIVGRIPVALKALPMPCLGLQGGGRWGCDFGTVAAGDCEAGEEWRALRGLQIWKPQRMIAEREMLLVGVHREQTSGKPVLSPWGECKQAKGKGQRSIPSALEVLQPGFCLQSHPVCPALLFFSSLVCSCLAASGCPVFSGAQMYFKGGLSQPWWFWFCDLELGPTETVEFTVPINYILYQIAVSDWQRWWFVIADSLLQVFEDFSQNQYKLVLLQLHLNQFQVSL